MCGYEASTAMQKRILGGSVPRGEPRNVKELKKIIKRSPGSKSFIPDSLNNSKRRDQKKKSDLSVGNYKSCDNRTKHGKTSKVIPKHLDTAGIPGSSGMHS
jgi:hypothetical protein